MNKKLIALALVLFIAVGGLFAALPDPAVARLYGTIGDVFKHGFTTGAGKYQASADNGDDNAFVIDPKFTYGFKAKHDTAFNAVMTVSSFKKGGESDATDVVGIDKVVVVVKGVTGSNTHTGINDTKKITVLSYTNIGSLDMQEATITVTPEAVDESLPTDVYVSTLSVAIVTT